VNRFARTATHRHGRAHRWPCTHGVSETVLVVRLHGASEGISSRCHPASRAAPSPIRPSSGQRDRVLQGSLYLVTRIADWICGRRLGALPAGRFNFERATPQTIREDPAFCLRVFHAAPAILPRNSTGPWKIFFPLSPRCSVAALFPAVPECTLGRCPGDFVSIGNALLTVAPQLHQRIPDGV